MLGETQILKPVQVRGIAFENTSKKQYRCIQLLVNIEKALVFKISSHNKKNNIEARKNFETLILFFRSRSSTFKL